MVGLLEGKSGADSVLDKGKLSANFSVLFIKESEAPESGGM